MIEFAVPIKKKVSDSEAWKKAMQNRGLIFAILDSCFPWIFYEDKSEVMSRDDYEQEAMMGLFTAAKKFDPDRGEFSTYAWPWIYQAISRAYRAKHFKGARVAYGVYEILSKIKKKHPDDSTEWIHRTGRPNVIDGHNALTNTFSLNQPKHSSTACNESPLMEESLEFSCDPDQSLIREIDKKSIQKMVRKATKCLSEKEQKVLFMRFGLEGKSLSRREVAKELKITKHQVTFYETLAIEKVQYYFKEKNWKSECI